MEGKNMNKKKKGILVALIFIATSLVGSTESAVAITPVTSEFSSSSEAGTNISAGEIVEKVCKVLVTVVAVSARVTAVVRTGGVLLAVSKEIVKYVTVPTIICQWL